MRSDRANLKTVFMQPFHNSSFMCANDEGRPYCLTFSRSAPSDICPQHGAALSAALPYFTVLGLQCLLINLENTFEIDAEFEDTGRAALLLDSFSELCWLSFLLVLRKLSTHPLRKATFFT